MIIYSFPSGVLPCLVHGLDNSHLISISSEHLVLHGLQPQLEHIIQFLFFEYWIIESHVGFLQLSSL